MAAFRHLQQRATAGLLDVIAMSRNGQDVGLKGLGHRRQALKATATPSRSGMMVVYHSGDE